MKQIKFLLIPLTAAILMTAGCDKKPSAEAAAETSGNWQIKADSLSKANPADIKADLTLLNEVTNTTNADALALRDEVLKAGTDQEKIKDVLSKSNDLQEKVKEKIMAMNLKSAEVQNIRTQMIDNLMTSEKLYDISTASNFNMQAPTEEFIQLSQRSVAIQQKLGSELNALNAQYAQ